MFRECFRGGMAIRKKESETKTKARTSVAKKVAEPKVEDLKVVKATKKVVSEEKKKTTKSTEPTTSKACASRACASRASASKASATGPVAPKAAAKKTNSAPKERAVAVVDQDAIRNRAWEIWQSEGCPEGRADEHWRRAEQELKARI